MVTGSVSTLKVPLPDRVLNSSEPEGVVAVLCSPEGSWSLLPLFMQPDVTSAVADSVAVAALPAPATSPWLSRMPRVGILRRRHVRRSDKVESATLRY